ncbi:MAG TPA: ROK family protein [Mycobacteriales bacterium]|nr:ROK family protein [Mycobacteriales bacterium]
MSSPDLVLAIDVGGTKLAVGLVDQSGSIVRSARVVTPTADGEGIWSVLSSLVDGVVSGVAPVSVGIGCGGPLRLATGEVSPLNIPCWRDFPLLACVEARFAGVPVRLHNDAVAMAVGEHWRGAGQGAPNMLGIVVSTGVGGGLVIDDRVVSGCTGNAGHIGHVTVDLSGPLCTCGNRGCLEAIARGPAVVAWALDHGWMPTTSTPDGVALVADARAGDERAVAALRRAGEALGVAFASAAHLLELDRVVVGGGLAVGAGDLLFGPLRDAFSCHAHMEFAARCEIVPAALGGDAGIVGAAALVLEPRYLDERSARL